MNRISCPCTVPRTRPRAAEGEVGARAGWRLAGCALLLAIGFARLPAAAQTASPDTNEAATLYATHCRACHTDQVHWRDSKRARDWEGLVREVGRWQTQLGLNWSGREVRAVARHLNRLYYRFPTSEGRVVGQLLR